MTKASTTTSLVLGLGSIAAFLIFVAFQSSFGTYIALAALVGMAAYASWEKRDLWPIGLALATLVVIWVALQLI